MTYKELYESAIDKLEKSKITLGEFEKVIEPLNAEIATADSDTISRAKAIEALKQQAETMSEWSNRYAEQRKGILTAVNIVEDLPPAQPEPSQVAKDIARIVENGQDMRVIAQSEIIYCKDCKKHNKHYHESPYKDTVCPLTAWRGKARGHEYDYQYCCYAERREVTE